MPKNINIGWISAAAYATTGYGRMCREIAGRLIGMDYNVLNVGGIGGVSVWGGKFNAWPSGLYKGTDGKIYDKSEMLEEQTDYKQLGKIIKGDNYTLFDEITIPIVPTVGQLAGQDVIELYIKKYNLDLLITHWDCFVLGYLQNLNIPTIAYLPIDAPFTEKMHQDVKKLHKIVAFSKFGYSELLKWFRPHKVDYIPHGINTNEWKPMDKDKARSRAFDIPDMDRIDERFIISNVGANIGERKQIPNMMLIFQRFLKWFRKNYPDEPEPLLSLFTNSAMGFPKGYDLTTFANMLGIRKNVFFPQYDPMIEPWSNEQMREMYCASDVYLTTTLGEGFGVPMLESMACGTPVIGPNCSSVPELVKGHGWIAELNPDYIFIPVWIPTLQQYPVVSMDDTLDCLKDAYHNPEKVEDFRTASREFSLTYDWKKVMPLWDDLLLKTELYINSYIKML